MSAIDEYVTMEALRRYDEDLRYANLTLLRDAFGVVVFMGGKRIGSLNSSVLVSMYASSYE